MDLKETVQQFTNLPKNPKSLLQNSVPQENFTKIFFFKIHNILFVISNHIKIEFFTQKTQKRIIINKITKKTIKLLLLWDFLSFSFFVAEYSTHFFSDIGLMGS